MRWEMHAGRAAGAAMPFRSRADAPAAATNTKPDAPIGCVRLVNGPEVRVGASGSDHRAGAARRQLH